MARSMLSFGMFSRLQVAMIERNVGFVSGSGPPAFTAFTAVYKEEKVPVSLPIPGRFTVYNALTALGIALQLGVSLAEGAAALADCRGVRGRVEVVPTPGKDFTVLIDYAHTPDGASSLSSFLCFCMILTT